MTDVINQLITNAATEAGIVAVLTVNTKPEHDPYVNIAGHSSTTTLHIDPRDRTAWVSQEYRTGSTTMDNYHGLTLEQRIADHPNETEVREWLTVGEGQELLRVICNGFDTRWNGNNNVGTYSDEAMEAMAELDRELDDEGQSRFGEYYQYWPVEELGDAAEWGVTAETTDEELEQIAANINDTIAVEHWVTDGVVKHLSEERSQMREQAEYEAELAAIDAE